MVRRGGTLRANARYGDTDLRFRLRGARHEPFPVFFHHTRIVARVLEEERVAVGGARAGSEAGGLQATGRDEGVVRIDGTRRRLLGHRRLQCTTDAFVFGLLAFWLALHELGHDLVCEQLE